MKRPISITGQNTVMKWVRISCRHQGEYLRIYIHCRPIVSQDCDLPLSFLPLIPFYYSFTRNSSCLIPSPYQPVDSWSASSIFQPSLFKATKRKRGCGSPQLLAYGNNLPAIEALLPQGLTVFGIVLTRTVLSVHTRV